MTKTTFAGTNNPFTGTAIKTTERTPERKKRPCKTVDIHSLQIVDDPVQVNRATVSAKYGELFSKMKPGQAIKCQPDEAGKIGHALNTWLKKRGIPGNVKTCRRYEADGLGRVWLLAPTKGKKGGAA